MGGREGGREREILLLHLLTLTYIERVQLQNRNEYGEQQEQENKQNNGGNLLPLDSTLYTYSIVERDRARKTGMQQKNRGRWKVRK